MIKEVRTSNRVVYNVVSYLPCSSTTFAMSKSAHCNQNKDRRVLTLKRRAYYRAGRNSLLFSEFLRRWGGEEESV